MPINDLTRLTYGVFNGEACAFKRSFDVVALKREADAVRACAGHGMVRLLAYHDDLLTIVRVVPGYSLREYAFVRDFEACRIAADLMDTLHTAPIPVHHDFPHVRELLRALDLSPTSVVASDDEAMLSRASHPLIASGLPSVIASEAEAIQTNNQDSSLRNYVERARFLRDRLCATAHSDVLLHGDLHHDNILADCSSGVTSEKSDSAGADVAHMRWIAIDPKGMIGEAAYEVGAFIRNPMDRLIGMPDAREIISARVSYFAERFGVHPERIRAWCFVQAVLAWVWALEDGVPTETFAKIAELFDTDSLSV